MSARGPEPLPKVACLLTFYNDVGKYLPGSISISARLFDYPRPSPGIRTGTGRS